MRQDMRRHFELFLRCIGGGLLCAGVILSVRASLALMQPMPDVSGGWSELLRSKELAGKVPDFFQQARDGYLRAALMELVAFGLTPLALGVLLLKLARPIAAWNYPSAGEGPPAPGEEPI